MFIDRQFISLADTSLSLDYLSWPALAGLFVALSIPILLLSLGRFSGIAPARKWTIVSFRLCVLAMLLFILGGLRWDRLPSDVQVTFLRDASQSADHVSPPNGRSVQDALTQYFTDVSRRPDKPAADRVGLLSFRSAARVDSAPQNTLSLTASSVREADNGTNVAAAIDLAMAAMSRDTMNRFLLAWDGNATAGDLDNVLDRAAALHVPIDVMPLRYDLNNEVLVERVIAPAWRRQGETFSLEIILRSTGATPARGTLAVTDGGVPIEIGEPPSLTKRAVTLNPGANVVRVRIPPGSAGGVHRFRAVFEPDAPAAGQLAYDTVVANNVAEAFTFVRGKGRVLFVDNNAPGQTLPLRKALAREGVEIAPDDVVPPDAVPADIVRLQNFDAIILANVPRGAGGLSETQQAAVAAYVHDLGGGLLMIGGPDAFGAGGWQDSAIEKVLPVTMDVPARNVLSRGALTLVIDHSGSMGAPLGNSSKQQVVNEAAVLALKAMSANDMTGVLAFDSMFEWVLPLAASNDLNVAEQRMRQLAPAGGTSIYPALEEAIRAMKAIPESEVGARHIVLLTDGRSQPGDYDTLLQTMTDAGISLSTVGVGTDVDEVLLNGLAMKGKGRYYGVKDAATLPQIFIREARVARRSLIKENRSPGLAVQHTPSQSDLVAGVSFERPLYGMVLTTKKTDPGVDMPLVAGPERDPLLASWQTGLGRSAVFTSDATSRWSAEYVADQQFGKFWAQVIRSVARPPMSTDFDLRVEQAGDRGHIVVEALRNDNAFLNFATVNGMILRPDGTSQTVRAVQTAPGIYTADFDASAPGVYATALTVTGKNVGGALRGGLVVNDSAELRPLHSDEVALRRVAERTGGRVLPAWDVSSADVFSRDGLNPTPSPLPVWDVLLMITMGALLLDVAARRISFGWTDARHAAAFAASQVRGFTLVTRPVENTAALAALRKVKRDIAADREDERQMPELLIGRPAGLRPVKPIQPVVREPETSTESGIDDLMAAKRRARQRMENKTEE